MKKIILIICLIITSLFSASFDCKKAKTDVEKLVCSDEKLSKLDEELNIAYKNVLSGAKTLKDKEDLKKRQIAWLKKLQEDCKKVDKCVITLQYEYTKKTFFLQPDGFNIIYSEDNKTCNWFANLLNNDLKQYKEINLSRHKEFNWVEWKQIQKEEKDVGDIFINYFDINNDGKDEGVFLWNAQYKEYIMPDIKYTTKEDGKSIEEHIPFKSKNFGWVTKEIELLNLQLPNQKNVINDGFCGYTFTKSASHFLYNNNQTNYAYIREKGLGGFVDPEPYPLKFDNNYFLAVFGTIELLVDNRYRYSPYIMLNSGNIVALVKYNPDNTKNDVCILTRANPNTERYLKYK
ncbi:MAG: lysozyme inhibitor LprI family protein [Campylobacteraceae bacterium]|jgi:uncharacterized protein YecT (DUF1311 family)|nr:lysozyme inhibitor LprI family protein [Campylobacteraceae bacterium]